MWLERRRACCVSDWLVWIVHRRSQLLCRYARLIPPGICYKEASIGRVVVRESARKFGLARTMMGIAIANVRTKFGGGSIRIGAQTYLRNFYASLGFVADGDNYIEDDIEHVLMVLA